MVERRRRGFFLSGRSTSSTSVVSLLELNDSSDEIETDLRCFFPEVLGSGVDKVLAATLLLLVPVGASSDGGPELVSAAHEAIA